MYSILNKIDFLHYQFYLLLITMWFLYIFYKKNYTVLSNIKHFEPCKDLEIGINYSTQEELDQLV